MALPSINDFLEWSGNKFTNTQWDANWTKIVQVLTSGTYDLKIDKLECGDITANSIDVATTNGVPTGAIQKMATTYAPTGYLRTAGANHLISSYENLFYAVGHIYGPGDGVAVASSGVTAVGNVCTVTAVAHGLANGSYVSVKFTDVASSVVINRGVKIENVSANTFDFSVVGWLEQPVSPLTFTPATTFPVPNTQGYADRDVDSGATIDPDAATRLNRGDGTTGAQVGTTQLDQLKEHDHPVTSDNGGYVGPFCMIEATDPTPGPSFWDFTITDNNLPLGTSYDTDPSGGNQTNTANIALYWYIKT